MDIGASSYRLYLEGNESAFDQIVKEYRDPLTLFINGYVHDICAAEDIAIDVFADLAVNTGRYNFKIPLKNYLYMIARSRALDHLRYINRRRTVPLDEVEPYIADEPFEDKLIFDERRRKLYRALEALPEKTHTALYLVYFEELSYEEAARVMKISRKQVDNLVYRGKGMLRSILGEEDEFV